MKVTALLTGRGNNTLKDKNVLDVLGHPVRAYSLYGIINQLNGCMSENSFSSPVWDIVRLGYEKYKPFITICDSIQEIK